MSAGFLRRPADVAYVVSGDVVFVAHVPAGPMAALPAPGGLIWREAIAAGRQGLAERVAAQLGVAVADVRSDVDAFVAELIVRGLLEEVTVPDELTPG